jgi:hypothetical protein
LLLTESPHSFRAWKRLIPFLFTTFHRPAICAKLLSWWYAAHLDCLLPGFGVVVEVALHCGLVDTLSRGSIRDFPFRSGPFLAEKKGPVAEPPAAQDSINCTAIMRVHRVARAATLAEARGGSVCAYATRPRFLCTNGSVPRLTSWVGGKLETRRCFSQSRIVRAGAAEAV